MHSPDIRQEIYLKVGHRSALLLSRSKVLSALWAVDVLKIDPLHIGG
jgi:hypothetical protein